MQQQSQPSANPTTVAGLSVAGHHHHSSHSIHFLELPELVTNVLLNLQTEERAKSRLINKTFNQVYLIEEEDEFVKLWKRYSDGHPIGYEEKTLTEEEVLQLQKEFEIPCLQYHLKIWLTKCSNGRFEPEDLLIRICNTADWASIFENVPFFGDNSIATVLKDQLDEQLFKNLICVHKLRRSIHFMDKRNGQFYGYNSGYWEKIGNIKEWLESIPFDILSNFDYGMEEIMDGYLDLVEKGDQVEIINYFRSNLQLYPHLSQDLKRNEQVLEILTNNNYESQHGFYCELSASIPIDIRQNKEKVLKYFKVADFSDYLPTKLRHDKDFIISLLEEHGSRYFMFYALPEELLKDVRILELVQDTIVHMLGDGSFLPNFELDTVEKVMIFKDVPSTYPYISEELLNDKEMVRSILRLSYGPSFNEEHELMRLEQQFEYCHPLLMILADPHYRNLRDLMIKLPEEDHHLLFLGDSLKKDLDLLAMTTPTILRRLNIISELSKDEFYILLKKIQEKNHAFPRFYFSDLFSAIKDQIPKEFFNDRSYVLEYYALSRSKVLIGKNFMNDVDFWREICKADGCIDNFIPIEDLRNDKELILSLENPSVRCLSKELLKDIEFLKEFLVKYELPYEYPLLSKEIRSNKELLMHLTQNVYPTVVQYSSLVNDPDVINLVSQVNDQQ